ncbi:GRIP domain-containing protein RUD3-like [Spodoptera litura]|uniref:GRIP domain-containing protein RUD3-like n=1 Tax=Spodoptera litura TaxID=69820 RepID=A0A9J7E504_SPOLT|nr:GRIP domain-containing protein RUD3-like [Spodoptera litura]
MDDNDTANLDVEFKRYLQLLRPYLGQLVDQNIIKICDAWIQRLSDCKEDEKALRNKYVFVLCYQLARGVLDLPFLNQPPDELQPLSDDLHSEESSTEVEYLVINSEEPRTKVIFNNKKQSSSETDCFSQEFDKATESLTSTELPLPVIKGKYSSSTGKNLFCYTCPQVVHHMTDHGEEYEYRANNLVKKLREIKMQNMLLQKELVALKDESKNLKQDESIYECVAKVDNATSAFIRSNDSNVTLKSLKCQLQEVQDSRNTLIQTINSLQDELDQVNEMRKNEQDDLEAKHKLELIKVRTAVRDETKVFYEKKIEELRQTYEETINKIQDSASHKVKDMNKIKDDLIEEKDKLLEAKDAEIRRLRTQLEDQKNNLHTMLNKFMERSNDEGSCDAMKLRTQQLEIRLGKLEKAKAKCAKIYETKLAQLQREKHLAECSLQLQLVRQRAQVVNEMTDENQAELSTSLDKLETKYKDIVANVQATAIQRRMQDQLALESIFQAACGIHEQNQMPFSKPARNQNQSYDSEISSLLRGNKVGTVIVGGGNKSFGEDSLTGGFCLNGERMGELFERVYIPQRDNGEAK